VPYGLATWALLGAEVGVPTPVVRSLVDVAPAAAGVDFWKAARTPDDLGIAGMDRQALLAYLEGGA
jgi:hypothetical protein